jgi:hypothetical protein
VRQNTHIYNSPVEIDATLEVVNDMATNPNKLRSYEPIVCGVLPYGASFCQALQLALQGFSFCIKELILRFFALYLPENVGRILF